MQWHTRLWHQWHQCSFYCVWFLCVLYDFVLLCCLSGVIINNNLGYRSTKYTGTSPSPSQSPYAVHIILCFRRFLFGSKLGFMWIPGSLWSTLWRVFTRSDITPPKVSRFGWKPKHYEYIVRGWSWQILGAICAEARAGEPGETGEILFFLSGK